MDDLYSLAQGLRDGSTKRRRETIKQLAQYDDPDVMRYLAWAYRNDPDADNRQLAYRAGQAVRKRQQEADDQAYSYSGYGGGSTSSYSSSYTGYGSASAYDDSAQSDYEYGTSYSYYDAPASSGYDPYSTADDHPYDTQPAKPAKKQSSAAARARAEAFERKQQRLNAFLVSTVGLMYMICTVAIHVDFMLWVDLSDLPLRNGTTVSEAVEQGEGVLDLRRRRFLGDGVVPGFTGYSTAAVLTGNMMPATGMFDSNRNVETVRRETGMQIALNPYPGKEGHVLFENWDVLGYVVILGWIICLLPLSAYYQLEQQRGFMYNISVGLRSTIKAIGPRTFWLLCMIFSGIYLTYIVMFFVESSTFTPQVVALMQLDLAPGTIVDSQLGIGFWDSLFATGLGLLGSVIGFVGIDEPKEKGA